MVQLASKRRLVGLSLIALILYPLATLEAAPPSRLAGAPIDETYRNKFTQCDKNDRFGTVQFPIRRANGKIKWYGCRSDPSRLTRFERITHPGKPEAVLWEAKLAHDLDGSAIACNTPGATDQCTTTLMLRPTAALKCPKVVKQRPYCLPVDAGAIPYIVIPSAAPPGIDSGAFARLSKIRVGDVGMVLANDRMVPVIVADTGPAYKMGEGSTALLRALSTDGKPHTISRGVVFVVFPNSALSRDANADTLKKDVAERAQGIWAKL